MRALYHGLSEDDKQEDPSCVDEHKLEKELVVIRCLTALLFTGWTEVSCLTVTSVAVSTSRIHVSFMDFARLIAGESSP